MVSETSVSKRSARRNSEMIGCCEQVRADNRGTKAALGLPLPTTASQRPGWRCGVVICIATPQKDQCLTGKGADSAGNQCHRKLKFVGHKFQGQPVLRGELNQVPVLIRPQHFLTADDLNHVVRMSLVGWPSAAGPLNLTGNNYMSDVPIGLIAGSKSLPLLFAREARKRGERVAAVAFEGETDPELAGWVDSISWVKVGQLGKMLQALVRQQVRQCVMLGQIAPKNLFDLRPDLRAMAILLRLKERNAHSIFGAIADELAKEGIELVPAVPWLQPWMPRVGYCCGQKLSSEGWDDVTFGLRMARETSRLEIGQCVVVKRGTVLAVEAFEGTDECLERGGRLAGKDGGAVAVKVAKPGHDFRFDIPCVGPMTLAVCQRAGVSVLAVESGRTLLLDLESFESDARRLRISVVATDSSGTSPS